MTLLEHTASDFLRASSRRCPTRSTDSWPTLECSLLLATNADDAAGLPPYERPSDLDKEPNASGSIGHITSGTVQLRMGLIACASRSLPKATLIRSGASADGPAAPARRSARPRELK
jgi:hypothetical protein